MIQMRILLFNFKLITYLQTCVATETTSNAANAGISHSMTLKSIVPKFNTYTGSMVLVMAIVYDAKLPGIVPEMHGCAFPSGYS